MKLSRLLNQRAALLRQTRLANLAYAYDRLAAVAERVSRARLGGAVVLQPVDPSNERFCASLTALERSPAVLEEHFTDEDVAELAEVLGYVTGNATAELAFALEDIGPRFLTPVRQELRREGVVFDDKAPLTSEPGLRDLPNRPHPNSGS